MPASSSDLHFYGTKSTGVVDGESGHDGLGGLRSSDELLSSKTLPLVALTGVAINRVAALAPLGQGSLVYLHGANTIAWKAPGDSAAGAPQAATSGNKILQSTTADMWLDITIVAGNLPGVDVTEIVYVDPVKNVLFGDVSMNEAESGTPTYRAVWLRNLGAPMLNFRPYFDTGIPNSVVGANLDYPHSGSYTVDGDNNLAKWPRSGFFRNLNTLEIMYYSARVNQTLTVPASGRRQRSTSSAAGYAADVLEYVGPADLGFQIPIGNPPKGTIILADRIPPLGVTFEYPTDAVPVQSSLLVPSFTTDLIVWMKRTTPVAAHEIVREVARLTFKFD